MRKRFILLTIMVSAVLLTGFAHKFYVGIFQINYAPEKKMLQVTTRIFVDDLENALEKKYGHRFHLGEASQTQQDVTQMKQYLAERLIIEVNGQPQSLTYLSNELENTVLICYYRVANVEKITSLRVKAKVLFDYVTDQQNIIQTNINGKKSSLLLTPDNPEGTVNL